MPVYRVRFDPRPSPRRLVSTKLDSCLDVASGVFHIRAICGANVVSLRIYCTMVRGSSLSTDLECNH